MAVHFPTNKATFIHVPKTGGTSFYNWIERNVPSYDMQAHNVYETGSMLGAAKQWGELGTTFSFVRNPYSRLVSMYHYHYAKAQHYVRSPNVKHPGKMIDFLKVIAVSSKGFEYWLECMYYEKEQLLGIADAARDRLTVCSWYNGQMPDIIIKMEELDSQFYKIQDLLGCHTESLPHDNKSEHKPYREYYNDKMVGWVAEQFKEDLEAFGYQY